MKFLLPLPSQKVPQVSQDSANVVTREESLLGELLPAGVKGCSVFWVMTQTLPNETAVSVMPSPATGTGHGAQNTRS